LEIPLLEIPAQQRQTHQDKQPVVANIPPLSSVQPTYQPTYLGLRYATADTCLYMELTRGDSAARQECRMDTHDSSETQPEGVKVLSVIAGSPGERAGFEGADAPPDGKDYLVKAGLAILALSPVGPLAIPLAMAYDAYTGRHIPGDLIIGVDGTQVRTAQEFNAAMSRYQPGTAVTFTVMRAGEPLRLTVRLEAESGLE
jgi:S1-C subfamily serine protease